MYPGSLATGVKPAGVGMVEVPKDVVVTVAVPVSVNVFVSVSVSVFVVVVVTVAVSVVWSLKTGG